MIEQLPPGLILILGAALVPLLRNPGFRNAYMLALPVVGFWGLTQIEPGIYWSFTAFGYQLAPVRVDSLSLIFGYIFHIATALCIIYAFHLRDTVQQVAGLVYAGSAIGGVFAGDMITLFVCWEGTAVSSVFLIWASRSDTALRSGMRYLVIQVTSGVLLMAGALLHHRATGSIAFDRMSLTGIGPTLIFLAFGIKAAFPLLHNWLQDAYPNGTVTGTVFLSAFTTKLAIYALARGFPGVEMLVWIGAAMAIFPIFYALIENDLRRVLAYSLNHQLGFMVIGIGIGTELALNGAAAHAFASVLYKALLFMAMGAVLLRTGTCKGDELGGLVRTMPWTAAFCLIGAASISAFPLLSGFVSKSLIVSAAAERSHWFVWALLLTASAGAVLHTAVRVPLLAFFNRDSGKRPEEAPLNMRLAMALTALLCIGLGVAPGLLYAHLPFSVSYEPYTAMHVVTQLQLIFFAVLGYWLLTRINLFPLTTKSMNLDFDWFYRRPGMMVAHAFKDAGSRSHFQFMAELQRRTRWLVSMAFRHHGPEGVLARTWETGSTVLWVAVLLVLYLIFYFV